MPPSRQLTSVEFIEIQIVGFPQILNLESAQVRGKSKAATQGQEQQRRGQCVCRGIGQGPTQRGMQFMLCSPHSRGILGETELIIS